MSIEDKRHLFTLMTNTALQNGHATNASIETVIRELQIMIEIEPSLGKVPPNEISQMILNNYTSLHMCLTCSGITRTAKNKQYPKRCICFDLEDKPY